MLNIVETEPIISIHAPTRGATNHSLRRIHKTGISIHAPTRGATQQSKTIMNASEFQSTLPREERRGGICIDLNVSHFNPRSHERSDLSCDLLQNYLSISIHAPTRGATLDPIDNATIAIFQSTLPREERLIGAIQALPTHNFNPRSHERSDCQRQPLKKGA